ncbi:MAG: hypothetical protein A3J97_00330 [Spirochaetes bacterium RIFOXYC1_FULL_54_7]|nr:MAG: hypothetical protein A3J97_00330 [Spirochaetes bacterium RIFOXYC1_FULL_54_7]
MSMIRCRFLAGISVILVVTSVFLLTGCGGTQEEVVSIIEGPDYRDGTYRGSFIDKAEIQLSIQFNLQRNIVTSIEFNGIAYQGKNCLESPWGPQYLQAIKYLVGKDIRDHLEDLYTPGKFVDDVDGFSGATIRAGKIRSAIQDALNRNTYSL